MAEKKGKVNIGAVIILIISVVVFIPVGSVSIVQLIQSNKAEKEKAVFGSYGDKKIAWEQGSDFVNRVSNYAQFYQQYGIDINQNTQYRDQIIQQSYQETLETYAYSAKVSKTGYTVSSKEVDRQIMQQFKDADGNFDKNSYDQADKDSLASYKASVKDSILAGTYTDDLLGESTMVNGQSLYGAKVSSKEVDFIASMGAEKHSFQLLQWAKSDYPAEEVLAFGKENAEKFTKYDMSALTFDSKETAETTLKQLTSNEITFEDAATRSSQLYTDALGKLTSNYSYAIENEILVNKEDFEKITSLAKDALSAVIETKQPYSIESSWTIFRCDGEKTVADFNVTLPSESEATAISDDEEAKAEESLPEILTVVKTYMTSYEAGHIENYFMDKAKIIASKAKVSSFEEAAADAGLEIVTCDPFPLNYGNSQFFDSVSSQGAFANISRNEDVLKKIFALDVDEISEPMVIGSYVALVKCTGLQKDNVADIDKSSYNSTIVSNNQLSLSNALNDDPKVKDNFWSTYINTFGMPSSFSAQ